ncbi:MAG TPA: prolyl oligopeptidase family serine peptidase [Thermoanaerobaculia bacterium]|nr:prolyl oligopeptidase family serine peptidase [Thermoanaerobaculia bacterium]
MLVPRIRTRRPLSATAVLLSVLVAPAIAADPPFTVSQVLSSPFPSNMEAAPTGGHVAWVVNDRGERNLWVASPPEYRGRQVTRFAGDDGQEMGSIAWSADAGKIAFVRGGPPNASGELPNPLSDPTGVETAIWVVDLGAPDAEPRKIAPGSSPLFRPDGSLLFVAKGDVMFHSLAESAPEDGDGEAAAERSPSERSPSENAAAESAKPVRLITARGGLGSLRLSPDGSQLALVSGRGDHSFVGVYDFDSKKLHFLDPSVDRDGAPVWSPDGRRLAFLRIAASAAREIFAPVREAQPWSIRVVDVASGEAREVWRALPGGGSAFRGTASPDDLIWTTDGHLIFPWERDGWTHLYAIRVDSPSRQEARLLTPGDFEVEYVERDASGRGVVYSSNQGDIDRRHLWRVTADGLPPEQLTSGDGVENDPAPTSDGCCVAFVGADGRAPLAAEILRGNGSVTELMPGALPADFPLEHLVEPEQVILTATDGLRIHAQLFEPPSSFAGERPALIFFHGGSRRHMMLGWHYSSYYHNAYAFNQLMASRGFVVISVNYRSGIGYGLEFREALDYGATGASELHDVLGAGLWLRDRDDVAPDAIGLWGGSYGGYLTAMGLAHASDLFAAGVDIHGVHDWNEAIQNFVPSYEPLEDPARTRLAFESSPMAKVDDWRSPVLLIHGDDDRNVPFSETVTLVEKLRELGVEHELLVFPDEVHSFLTHANWIEVFERSSEFLERHLGARAATPEREGAEVVSSGR